MHDDAPSQNGTASVAPGAGARAPNTPTIAPKRIVFLLYDGFQPLDLAGPWQAFSGANEEGGAGYQLSTVAATPVVAPLSLPAITVSLYWHERYQDDPAHAWLRQYLAGVLG